VWAYDNKSKQQQQLAAAGRTGWQQAGSTSRCSWQQQPTRRITPLHT
jgi:hypothetical protein